jgi:transcriptional regulator ATRX
VKKLKPHQANGVKFMWDACFESLDRCDKDVGSGCILAHCMGLGKTLQVVTLVHTLLKNCETTGVNRVLVVCPLSTVLNWVNEFNIWLKHVSGREDIYIYEINKLKQNVDRANKLMEWHNDGGIMILSYDMFRNLTNDTGNRLRKKVKESLQTSLVDPGPDLVVCDEGHLLKNEKTSISKAMMKLRTLRRIVLTGTPLQNNLKECELPLVVSPSSLDSSRSFRLLHGAVRQAEPSGQVHRVHEPLRQPNYERPVHGQL